MSSAEDKNKPELFEGLGATYRAFAPFLTMGIQLAVAVVAFFFAGYWVDQKFGSAPYGSLAGVLLGSVGGFIKFFRAVGKLTKQEESEKQTPREN